MCRYEELRTQLRAAQDAAQAEDEEAELARATAAVARLTAPSSMRLEPLAAGGVLAQLQVGPPMRPALLHGTPTQCCAAADQDVGQALLTAAATTSSESNSPCYM